jgi:hypothetical protein
MTRDLQATNTPGFIPTRHFLRRSLIAALVVCGLLSAPLSAVTVARKKEIARDQFENAERMREALNGRPAAQRSIRDYQRVMDGYRKVYYVAPSSSKADAAIIAVAELLVQKGRQFHNTSSCARNTRAASIASKRSLRSARFIKTTSTTPKRRERHSRST